MKRRVPCLLRGNFQMAFLIGLAALVALGILAAAACNYLALEQIFERASFSAHLSAASSGELVWRAVVEMTLLTAGSSLLVGCVAIVCALWYLEGLFQALADGLQRLTQGQRAVRLPTKGWWWGRRLLREFNGAAAALDQRAGQSRESLERVMAELSVGGREWLSSAKALQSRLRQLRWL